MKNFIIYRKVKVYHDDGSVDFYYVKRFGKKSFTEKHYPPADLYIDGKLQTLREKKIVISGTLVKKFDNKGGLISKEFWIKEKSYPELLQFVEE